MKKILIIKLGALGDVIMATSLIRQIQDYHKNDELWMLTTPGFAGIFENWQGLNTIALERKGLINFFRTISWIRKNHFDRIYDLQSNDRTSLLCALSGVDEIAGNHPRFPYTLHPADHYAGQCHIHERMLAVLEAAGINTVNSPPCLYVSDTDRALVASWLRDKHLHDRKIVLMHAGASEKHPEKCWPYFMELADALNKRGYSIIWTGAAAEAEANRQRASKLGTDASNIFTINQLAELGRQACFAVTNDSGPMHVLSSSGIPVFAFFGPTNWRRNHAVGQKDNVITTNKEAEFRPEPLERITVDQALSHLESTGVI